MNNTGVTSEKLSAFQAIVAEYLPSVETMETRGRDHLDFYDISVDTLARIMDEAYQLGQKGT